MGARGGWFQSGAGRGSSKWWRSSSRAKLEDKCSAQQRPKKAEQRPHSCPPWVGEVKVQVYAAPAPALDTQTAPHRDFLHLHCEVEFDPEKDYAQVLAEARSHLKVIGSSHNNTSSWSQATPPQRHLDAYRELQSKLGKHSKPSKLWRYLFFWQKPSSFSQQVEAEFESIFSSPPHPASQNLRKGTCQEGRKARSNNKPMPRATSKGTSGPLDYHPSSVRKNNSGPLYTDGLPTGPFNIKHTKKSYSGPLGIPMNCKELDPHLSPYQLLHRPTLTSPLYSCR